MDKINEHTVTCPHCGKEHVVKFALKVERAGGVALTVESAGGDGRPTHPKAHYLDLLGLERTPNATMGADMAAGMVLVTRHYPIGDRFGPDHKETIEEVRRLRRKYGETLTYAQVRDEMLAALEK